jgi:hypothetical protein
MRGLIARIAMSIALMVVALVAVLVALGYFVFALYLWLAEYLVPPAAALVSGAIVLLVALLLVTIARAMLRGSRRRRDVSPLTPEETAAQLGGLLGDKVQGFANLHRGSSLLTALAAGFAVGVSPKLRSILWRLFQKLR